jgi:hypothetical protein
MADASDKVEYTDWRIVRIRPERGRVWPFLELDVGESFVEGDLSKWACLRTKASTLRRRFMSRGMDRGWAVRKQDDVLIVTRTQ